MSEQPLLRIAARSEGDFLDLAARIKALSEVPIRGTRNGFTFTGKVITHVNLDENSRIIDVRFDPLAFGWLEIDVKDEGGRATLSAVEQAIAAPERRG